MIICQVYALGSGNVAVLPGVSVGEVWLEAGVSEIVVGGSEVCVREGVMGGDVGVPVPLQAATNNTSKSMNRLMYSIIYRLYRSHRRPQYPPNYLPHCC